MQRLNFVTCMIMTVASEPKTVRTHTQLALNMLKEDKILTAWGIIMQVTWTKHELCPHKLGRHVTRTCI